MGNEAAETYSEVVKDLYRDENSQPVYRDVEVNMVKPQRYITIHDDRGTFVEYEIHKISDAS